MNKILKTENGKIYQMNTLADTVVFMESDDHKDRFKAEYWQLRFRFNRLKTLLSEPSKTGDFGIATPIYWLEVQADLMERLLTLLEIRAIIEGIEL